MVYDETYERKKLIYRLYFRYFLSLEVTDMNRLNVLKNDTVQTFIKIRIMRIPSCVSLSM
jgi:hypothetical protein